MLDSRLDAIPRISTAAWSGMRALSVETTIRASPVDLHRRLAEREVVGGDAE